MSLPILLDSFQSSLAALQRLLDHFNNQGVIIGGIAVSLLAETRFTADADAVILLATDDLPRLPKIGGKPLGLAMGMDSRRTDWFGNFIVSEISWLYSCKCGTIQLCKS